MPENERWSFEVRRPDGVSTVGHHPTRASAAEAASRCLVDGGTAWLTWESPAQREITFRVGPPRVRDALALREDAGCHLTASNIAEILGVERSALTRALEPLRRRGLLYVSDEGEPDETWHFSSVAPTLAEVADACLRVGIDLEGSIES